MNKFAEDLLPMRETKVSFSAEREEGEEIFAVCLETDDGKLLVPFKVYRIALRGEYVRVIEEEGEVAVYPKSFFLPLQLPSETVNVLSNAYVQAL